MDAAPLTGGMEYMVMLPMVALVFFSVMKLDGLIGRPKQKPTRHLVALGVDKDGMPIFVEPDGHPLLPVKLPIRPKKL
jgi:hypothetical protein